jgi:hypothetical protein
MIIRGRLREKRIRYEFSFRQSETISFLIRTYSVDSEILQGKVADVHVRMFKDKRAEDRATQIFRSQRCAFSRRRQEGK